MAGARARADLRLACAALALPAVLASSAVARAQDLLPRQAPGQPATQRRLGQPAAQLSGWLDSSPQDCLGCCKLGFRGYSLLLTLEGSLLPIGSAALGAQERNTGVGLVPVYGAAQGVVALMEAGTLALAGRSRPLEHWAVILSVRGAATALAFLAGRYLQPGGAVLATTALVAASTVPLFVLHTDEARVLGF